MNSDCHKKINATLNKDVFQYKNKTYGIGTRLTTNGEDIYEFIGKTCYGNYFIFMCITPHCGSITLTQEELNTRNVIILEDKIILHNLSGPIYVDTTVGWIWYIVVMIISCMCKEFYFGWIAATFLFFAWRHSKLTGGK